MRIPALAGVGTTGEGYKESERGAGSGGGGWSLDSEAWRRCWPTSASLSPLY